MKKYVGTKEVKATPMSAVDALNKGYKVGNHKNEEGYEVEYADGYRSWSPKQVFEESYKCADTFLDRLRIEYDGLLDKIKKLDAFIHSTHFTELNKLDRCMLVEQFPIMQSYLNVLERRIDESIKNNS